MSKHLPANISNDDLSAAIGALSIGESFTIADSAPHLPAWLVRRKAEGWRIYDATACTAETVSTVGEAMSYLRTVEAVEKLRTDMAPLISLDRHTLAFLIRRSGASVLRNDQKRQTLVEHGELLAQRLETGTVGDVSVPNACDALVLDYKRANLGTSVCQECRVQREWAAGPLSTPRPLPSVHTCGGE